MTFAQPVLLSLLILIPLLAWGAWMAYRQRERGWQVLVSARLRKKLVIQGSPLARWLAMGCGLMGLALLLLGLSRPEGSEVKSEVNIQGRNLIIAIDTSRSMLVKDVTPDRLQSAKAITYELLERFPNDRIGLIAFAGSAGLQAPLTTDHNALRETLDQLTSHNIPTGGSNLAEAINLATSIFKRTGQRTHALIVLSDGELHEGELNDATFDARQAGVSIISVGIGTLDGDFVPDSEQQDGRFRDQDGKPVLSRLETAPLRTVAAETGGLFLTGTGAGLGEKIDSILQRVDAVESEGGLRVTRPPLFQFFVIPAIIFLLASMLIQPLWPIPKPNANAATSALALFLLFSLQPAKAWTNPLDIFRANQNLKNGKHEDALKDYRKAQDGASGEALARLKFAEGTAQYKLGKHEESAKAFSQALLSKNSSLQRDAEHQIANSLYHRTLDISNDLENLEKAISQLRDAIAHYDSALTIDPKHKPSLNNRALTQQFLERLEEIQGQQQQQQQQQQSGEGNPEDSENQEQQEAQDGEQKSQEPNPSEQEPSTQNQSQQDEGEKGNEENEQDSKNSQQGEEEQDGKPSEQNQQGQDGQKQPPKNGQDGQGKPGPRPREDETAEEFARRILQENADFQKDPLQGQRRQQVVDKDW